MCTGANQDSGLRAVLSLSLSLSLYKGYMKTTAQAAILATAVIAVYLPLGFMFFALWLATH